MKAFLEMPEDRRLVPAEMLYGESPDFDQILQRVQDFESSFNQRTNER